MAAKSNLKKKRFLKSIFRQLDLKTAIVFLIYVKKIEPAVAVNSAIFPQKM